MNLSAAERAWAWVTESRIAVLTAATYAIGWSINGLFLYWLNIVQLDSVSPRHLFTGILSLIVPGALAVLFIAFRPSQSLNLAQRIMLASMAMIVLGALVYLILVIADSDFRPRVADLLFATPAAVFLLFASIGLPNLEAEPSSRSAQAMESVKWALVAIAVLIYLVWFTGRIYPSIPMAFGGGRPFEADLVIMDERAFLYEEDLGKPRAQGSAWLFDNVFVFHRTDEHLYVRRSIRGSGRIVEVQRDAAILKLQSWRSPDAIKTAE